MAGVSAYTCSLTHGKQHSWAGGVAVAQLMQCCIYKSDLAGKDKPGQPLSKPLSGEGALCLEKKSPHIDLLSSLILLSLHLYDLLQLSIRQLVVDGEQGGHHSVLWCLHTPDSPSLPANPDDSLQLRHLHVQFTGTISVAKTGGEDDRHQSLPSSTGQGPSMSQPQ